MHWAVRGSHNFTVLSFEPDRIKPFEGCQSTQRTSQPCPEHTRSCLPSLKFQTLSVESSDAETNLFPVGEKLQETRLENGVHGNRVLFLRNITAFHVMSLDDFDIVQVALPVLDDSAPVAADEPLAVAGPLHAPDGRVVRLVEQLKVEDGAVPQRKLPRSRARQETAAMRRIPHNIDNSPCFVCRRVGMLDGECHGPVWEVGQGRV